MSYQFEATFKFRNENGEVRVEITGSVPFVPHTDMYFKAIGEKEENGEFYVTGVTWIPDRYGNGYFELQAEQTVEMENLDEAKAAFQDIGWEVSIG